MTTPFPVQVRAMKSKNSIYLSLQKLLQKTMIKIKQKRESLKKNRNKKIKSHNMT